MQNWSHFLNYALDFVRPLAKATGMFVSRLNEFQVEMQLPHLAKNCDPYGQLHSSVLVSFAEETMRVLLFRHLDRSSTMLTVKGLNLECLRIVDGTLKARFELSESERESFLFALRKGEISDSQFVVRIFDDKEQLFAQVSFDVICRQQLLLK